MCHRLAIHRNVEHCTLDERRVLQNDFKDSQWRHYQTRTDDSDVLEQGVSADVDRTDDDLHIQTENHHYWRR